jgi:hypothetical protein
MKGCGTVREKRCGGGEKRSFEMRRRHAAKRAKGLVAFFPSLSFLFHHFPKLASKGNLIYAIL